MELKSCLNRGGNDQKISYGRYNLREKLSGDLVLYEDHLAEIAKKEAEIAALKPEIARLKNQVAEAVNVSLLFREGEKV